MVAVLSMLATAAARSVPIVSADPRGCVSAAAEIGDLALAIAARGRYGRGRGWPVVCKLALVEFCVIK